MLVVNIKAKVESFTLHSNIYSNAKLRCIEVFYYNLIFFTEITCLVSLSKLFFY